MKQDIIESNKLIADADGFIDVNQFGRIAILDGTDGLPETENNLYKHLAKRNIEVLCLTDLFNKPKRVKVLKLLEIDTVVLGTTGVYKEKLNKVLSEFEKMNWLPKHAIFTMGEEYFGRFLKAGVKGYKIYPMSSMHQSERAFITEL